METGSKNEDNNASRESVAVSVREQESLFLFLSFFLFLNSLKYVGRFGVRMGNEEGRISPVLWRSRSKSNFPSWPLEGRW